MNDGQQQEKQQKQHQQQHEFYQAVIDNNLELVNTLFHLVDINALDEKKQTSLYYTIINQQWKMAQLLIEHKAQLANSNWSREVKKVVPNILHCAIQDLNIDESSIDFLLSQQPDIHIEQKGQNGYTPILTAARYGNIRVLKHLINNYNPNIHAKSSFFSYNLFHCAIFSKDQCTIELLDTINLLGVSINEIDTGKNRNASPLTLAIYTGSSFEIIQHLVELGADIITVNDRKYNPNGDKHSDPIVNHKVQSHLFKAIQLNDDYKVFNYLVESCPSSHNIPFKSILQQEFNDLKIESIKFIIEKYRTKFDADQHQIDLFQSVFQGFSSPSKLFKSSKFPIQIQMIEYLFEQNVQNCFKFHHTTYQFNYQTTSLIIFSQYPKSTLQLFQLLVQNGANVHDVDQSNDGVLHKLCRLEDTPVEDIISKIDYFISLGVDINFNIHPITKQSIQTPLHVAVLNKSYASILVPYLIQRYNADVTLSNGFNHVPLHSVTQPQLVPLLSTPSTINRRASDGCTPLLISLRYAYAFDSADEFFHVISKLFECGADVNIPNNGDEYPIHAVLQYNFENQPIEVIELLIKHHAIDLNVMYYQLTPLQLVIHKFLEPYNYHGIGDEDGNKIRLKSLQAMKLLLQYHADVTIEVSNGRTLLHYIAMNADYPKFQVICNDLIEECLDTIIDGIIDQVIINSNNSNNSNLNNDTNQL